MKFLIFVVLAAAACGPRPPSVTEDGKYCTWQNSGEVASTSGVCVKNNLAMTCMYVRDAEVRVVCGTSCPAPVEFPGASK